MSLVERNVRLIGKRLLAGCIYDARVAIKKLISGVRTRINSRVESDAQKRIDILMTPFQGGEETSRSAVHVP